MNSIYFNINGTKKRFILISLILVSFSFSLFADNNFNISNTTIEKIGLKYGKKAKKRVQMWNDTMKNVSSKNIFHKLKDINDFWNKIQYRQDSKVWQRKDYWASPFEFLAVGAGDSEDYAIAKYITLLNLGVSNKKLKILYMKNLSEETHAVLTYFHKSDSKLVVLDNINKNLTLKTKEEIQKTNKNFLKISTSYINDINQSVKIKYNKQKVDKEIILNTLKL
ncbi:transglutaminase-like cysteine peptidase [Halarcobacter sp.]|uniref:transglutaminase-like cysteine peptidase n=1 Tax=Halarcobacter sp. TaxID=2321133 RepID=UPI0029F4A342|nr:transglutaminase-like cysteine peptidase [Halarcobacter sp.]